MTALGASGIDVHPITLGGNTFGWTSNETESRRVLDVFASAGGNHIDTADSYSAWAPGNSGGESERIIGDWMAARSRRDDVVIATKVSSHPEFKGLAPANIAAAADASLARLRTDRIDLYYAHHDDPDVPIEDIAGAFDDLVTAGKVRAIGISNLPPERVEAWMAVAEANGLAAPVALQPHYNLLARERFEHDYAPLAEQHGLAVLPYFSLAAGFLTGKYRSREAIEGAARSRQLANYATDQAFDVISALIAVAEEAGTSPTTVALAWLLAKPTIAAPIASARTVDQLDDLMAAASLALSAEQLDRLDAVSAS